MEKRSVAIEDHHRMFAPIEHENPILRVAGNGSYFSPGVTVRSSRPIGIGLEAKRDFADEHLPSNQTIPSGCQCRALFSVRHLRESGF
jgi:hypothetical protein